MSSEEITCLSDADADLWPDWEHRVWLCGSLCLLIAVYCFCLALTIHNTVKYLIVGKRFRIFLISAFYALVILILSTRVVSLILFIRFFDGRSGCNNFMANEMDTCATYFKAILGV